MNKIPSRPSAPKSPIIAVPETPRIILPSPVFREASADLSIMPPEIENLVFVTGFRGSGKTTFGLGADHPDKILHLDFESKGKGLAIPLGVGGYVGVMDEIVGAYGEDYGLETIYERTLQIAKAIPDGRFTTVFLDNAAYLQDGCAQLIRRDPSRAIKYGLKPENVISGGYGGPWPAVKILLSNLFKVFRSKGVRLIIVSFQLSGAWKDGRPLFNKFKTTDVAIWHEMSILTVVLVQPLPRYMPCPRGLVMKEQLAELRWDSEKSEMVTKRRIPYALPRATMAEVYKYLKEPCDFSALKEGEGVDLIELGPYLPTFDKEQLILMERLARAAKTLQGDSDDEEEGSK